jgi:hypothetical protein
MRPSLARSPNSHESAAVAVDDPSHPPAGRRWASASATRRSSGVNLPTPGFSDGCFGQTEASDGARLNGKAIVQTSEPEGAPRYGPAGGTAMHRLVGTRPLDAALSVCSRYQAFGERTSRATVAGYVHLTLHGLQEATEQVRPGIVDPDAADSCPPPPYGDPNGLRAMKRSEPCYEARHWSSSENANDSPIRKVSDA